MYHNRGDSTFVGENALYGDFFGLDDLFTERPEVVDGMIDIYSTWVTDVGIDGFRIDTVKHVNNEFWQEWAPALVQHAASEGIDDFFMFGEVFDSNPAFTSHYTKDAKLQAMLDFPFQSRARSFASGSSTTGLRGALRRRRPLHRRRLQRLQPADVPRQPRHGPDRQVHAHRQRRRDGRRAARPRQARARADVPRPAASRSSTTATSRASPATAATRTRGRTCSRARSARTTTTT